MNENTNPNNQKGPNFNDLDHQTAAGSSNPLRQRHPAGDPGNLSGALESVHSGHLSSVQKLQQKERSFLSRILLERGLTKEIEQHRTTELKQYHQYRSDMIKLAADTKLEMCHEACLKMTRELKVSNRQVFSDFVTARHEELRRTVDCRVENFLADTDNAYSLAQKYEHRPVLAKRYIESIERSIEQYFHFIEGLLDNFINIARERVNQYRIED